MTKNREGTKCMELATKVMLRLALALPFRDGLQRLEEMLKSSSTRVKPLSLRKQR